MAHCATYYCHFHTLNKWKLIQLVGQKRERCSKIQTRGGGAEEDVLDKDMNGSDKENYKRSAWVNYHGVSDRPLCWPLNGGEEGGWVWAWHPCNWCIGLICWQSRTRWVCTMPGGRGGIETLTTKTTCASVKVIFAGIWIPHEEVQWCPLYDIPYAHLQCPPHDPQAATGWVGQCILQLQHCTHIIFWAGWSNLK